MAGRRGRLIPEGRDDEVRRLDRAVATLSRELDLHAENLQTLSSEAGTIAVALLASQRAILRDPQLIERTRALIRERGLGAERALQAALHELEARFAALAQPAFRALWRDVEELGSALLATLGGQTGRLVVDAGDVLVAQDVTVGDVIELVRSGAAGLVLEAGSLTSHVAVLCRSAGLPAVTGVAGALRQIADDTPLRIDGDLGQILVGPVALDPPGGPGGPATARDRRPDSGGLAAALAQDTAGLTLRANLDIDFNAARARDLGAQGVGLWRTFYLYLGRTTMPSEAELAARFRQVLGDFAPEPVTVRLLDLSGPFADDELPPELRNLGDCRGIRLLRRRPEVIATQLRALAAASDAGVLKVLVPFVTDPGELDAVRALADGFCRELDRPRLQIGAMIEVPAALLQLEALAARADFLAIGSNDLKALLLGQDRDAAPAMADPLHPALATALEMVVRAGTAAGVDVCLCGELAADPTQTGALRRIGLRELSMAPRLIPRVRAALLTLATLVLTACGAPTQQRDTIDQMVFVEEDAVEPADLERRRPPPRPGRPQGRGRPTETPAPSDWTRAHCRDPDSGPSRSVGRATDGSLDDGCELPATGRGYVCSHSARWGSDPVVAILQWAAAETVRIHGGSARVVIGALSREGGGRLRGHRSHQSGRDVDVGYFAAGDRTLKGFERMDPGDLDVERTWTLVGAMLHTGQVHYIFMDYDLQAQFYGWLQDSDVDESTLERIFQYPNGRSARRGIIRHAEGHRDHFHVRFRCSPQDGEDCVD